MENKEIIKALECCIKETSDCDNCPLYVPADADCINISKSGALDLINRQQAENSDLFYKLTGVMHSVDKWLDSDELKQDEVNRAATMREKTLQIVEKQQAEIERLRKEVNLVSILYQDLQERYEEAQTEIEQWKEEANKYQRLWCIAIDDIDDIETAIKEFISCATDLCYKEFENDLDVAHTFANILTEAQKEMVGEEE